MQIDTIHAAALAAIAEAAAPRRPRGMPDNIASARFTHRGMVIVDRYAPNKLGFRNVSPPAGTPGRPWRRQLARALYEDQQRKTRTPQRELVEADIASSKRTLPKATKLDRGSLAGIKQTGPQRLCKRYVRKPDAELTPRGHSSATA